MRCWCVMFRCVVGVWCIDHSSMVVSSQMTSEASSISASLTTPSTLRVTAVQPVTSQPTSLMNLTQQQQQQQTVTSFQPRLPSHIEPRPPTLTQHVQPVSHPLFNAGGHSSNATNQQDAVDLHKQPSPWVSKLSGTALTPNLTASASSGFPMAENVHSTAAGNRQSASVTGATSLSTQSLSLGRPVDQSTPAPAAAKLTSQSRLNIGPPSVTVASSLTSTSTTAAALRTSLTMSVSKPAAAASHIAPGD